MSDTQTEEENRTIKTSVVEGIVEEIIEEVVKGDHRQTVETEANNGYWDFGQTNLNVEGDSEIIEIVSYQRGDTNDKQGKLNEDKLYLDNVVEEWKSYYTEWKKRGTLDVKDFGVKTFLILLVLSAFHFYDFIVDNQLGWEFILGTKEKPSNKFYGIITLLIPFLPGIQWYASVKTVNQPFGKFLTSLLFPFFMIFFKVRSSFATDVMLITFRFSDW